MKKILLTLIALVMSIGISWAANKTVYLNPGPWNVDGAVFDAYVWNGSGDGWIEFSSTVTIDGNTCYKAEIADTWENLILVRHNPEKSRTSWNTGEDMNIVWNQTGDITFSDISSNTLFTITDWSNYSTAAVTSYSVRFATGLDWNPAYAYVWKKDGPTYLGNWPGAPMTASEETFTIDGVDETIYAINILTTNTAAPTNVVFNNGSGGAIGVAQTADLTFTDGKFYLLPTANPTTPTAPETRVVAIFSKTYNKELTESNNGWGGGPNPKYSSFDFPVINDGHYVVHVNGTAINGRASAVLDADHSILHVALWPTTATSCKIWDDNIYDKATVYNGLVPGQWNYVEITGVSFTSNYIGIELYNGETPETEFYLDHFYFSKPSSGDTTPPTFDKHVLKSANCISATLTLQATDETSETITYKVVDTATSTVYQTTGASGTAIDFTISPLAGSTEYTFSVTAMDENGNETAAETINATTEAIPNIPAITAAETHLLWDGNNGGAKNGFNFYDWGGGTGSAKTINEKNGFLISNFKWFGSQFTEVDASGMTYLEIDVLPSKSTTLAIVPINFKTEGEGNQPEKGTQFNVTAGEWNKLKVPVADVIENDGVTMTRLFQIKFVGSVIKNSKGTTDGFANGDGNMAFYVGNIYAYKETAPAGKTVTFKNSIGWDKVYAYVADAEWNAISEKWPGDEITSTLSWSTTSDNAKWVIFNNGEVQTADLEFTDGTEYDYGYYVVGNMNGWAKTDGYAMSRNTYCTSNVEYKLGRQDLTTTSMFKVALWNGVELSTNYPAGMGNSYGEHGEITADGTYNIFFRPNHDGGDDWFEKYIWAGVVGDLEILGADPTTGAMVLDGTWDGGEFGTLDASVKATSYDVTNLATTFGGGEINTAKKNALFIARADQNIAKNKVVDNGDGTYTGTNIVILDYNEYNGQDTEMNTQISPITGTINYHRTLPSANIYFTQVIPFTMEVPANITAYEATTSTSSAGIVNITFSEVTTMQAGVPYLLTATDAGAHFLNATSLDFSAGGDQALTDGAFKATYAPINPVPANTYVVAKNSNEATFRPASTGSYIPAFRAYLQLNDPTAKINVMFDDATGIHAATAEQLEGIFNIYSIDGKLVRQNGDKMGLNKGVYIINGKKVVVK